jgi:tetratricopeptide (TPR) repeat protein
MCFKYACGWGIILGVLMTISGGMCHNTFAMGKRPQTGKGVQESSTDDLRRLNEEMVQQKNIEKQKRDVLVDMYIKKGKELLQETRYEEALQAFNEALNADPSDKVARKYSQDVKNRIAAAKEKAEKETAQALINARKAEEHLKTQQKDEVTERLREKLGEAIRQGRAGNIDRGLEIARDVLGEDPNNSEAKTVVSWLENKRVNTELDSASAKKEASEKVRLVEVDEAYQVKKEPKNVAEDSHEEVSVPSSALEEKLQQVLQKVEFENAGFDEVIKKLHDMSGVNFVIDQSAFLMSAVVPALPGMEAAIAAAGGVAGAVTPGATPAGYPGPAGTPIGAPGPVSPGPGAPMGAYPPGTPGAAPVAGYPGGLMGGTAGTAVNVQIVAVYPKVSVLLENVTVQQALEAILRSTGLKYQLKENIILITNREEVVTELYHIRKGFGEYHKTLRPPIYPLPVGQVTATGGGGGTSGTGTGGTSSTTGGGVTY